jgi:Sulfite exporter TauE/SafE
MLRRRPHPATPSGNLSLLRVAPTGLGTGVLTGFFGIGGGFVIVPALVLLLGLPLTLAVGTSLLVITLTSGAALAAHLASGSIDWTIASTFTGAAIAGALAGRRLGASVRPERLGQLFALLLVAIAVFLVAKNASAADCRPPASDDASALDDGAQALLHLGGDRRKLVVADDREHPLRVDRGDPGLAAPLVDDHVAGQQHAELGFGLQRLVGERRVAGTEDQVRLSLDAELLPHRRVHVDLAQHPEPLRLQLGSHALDSLDKREGRRAGQCVTSGEHPHSSSR